MKFGVPWSVKGIRPEARETAKEAARRSGMPLGEWLNSVILQQAGDFDDEDAYGAQDMSSVHERLDDITRRLDQFSRKGPEAYAPRRDRAPAGPNNDQLVQLIARLDQRIESLAQLPRMMAPYAPPLAPQAPAWAHAPQMPAQMQPPMARPPIPQQPLPQQPGLPLGLDRAAADIAARQRSLNGIAPQAAPMAPPNAPLPHVVTAPATPAYVPAVPTQDLSGLEEHLRQITDQIETLRRPGVEDAINALRAELGDIGRALNEAMPRQAIDAIERQIQGLTQRIAEGRQNGGDAGALGGIEHGLAEVRDALRGLTPAENLVGFNDAVDGLAHKIDMIVARRDPEMLGQLERAITTLREMTGHVASNDAVSRLAAQVAELGDKVDHFAMGGAQDALNNLEHRISALADALAALPDAAPLEATRSGAEQTLAASEAEAEQARGDLARAESDEKAALAARDEAQGRRAAARAELAALESEAATLARATQRSGRDRLLDHVRAAPGYERALAAALGDDLEIGLDAGAEAHWAGADILPDDPALSSVRAEPVEALPSSAKKDSPSTSSGRTEGVALALHVTAPVQLARRLAQVVVVPEDDGRPLAVGQRLVTRTGQLRRWDGFVAKSGGAAAAERLERLNRLAAIEAALPDARAGVEAADNALAEIETRIAAARTAAGTARTALTRAEAAAREARQNIDRAVTQIERLAGQRTDLTARATHTATERDAAATEVATAEAAIVALPDTSATAGEVATLQREAEARRAAVVQARADRASRERAGAAARERLAASQAETKSWKSRAGDAARRIADMAKRESEIARDREALAGRPAALEADIAALAARHDSERSAADALAATEREAEAALRRCEEAARIAGEALAATREARAGALARAENQEQRRVELGQLSGERFECPAPVLPTKAGFDSATVRAPQEESAAHDKLTLDRERLGPVNLVAEQELAELEAGAVGNAAEREELGLAVNQLRGSIGTLNREGRQRLLAAFAAVNGHFQRLFTTLFNGGQAHLELVDSDDPLEAGLEIMAQPPGKRLQSLTLLSGGEQALTAVALIFGLFLTNPAPICVLDEVDAPLDDANIERFCDLLDRMTRETQTRYLIVTHNAVTMSRMHRLFGVTMIERGVSRLVSVDLQGAETLLAAE